MIKKILSVMQFEAEIKWNEGLEKEIGTCAKQPLKCFIIQRLLLFFRVDSDDAPDRVVR